MHGMFNRLLCLLACQPRFTIGQDGARQEAPVIHLYLFLGDRIDNTPRGAVPHFIAGILVISGESTQKAPLIYRHLDEELRTFGQRVIAHPFTLLPRPPHEWYVGVSVRADTFQSVLRP